MGTFWTLEKVDDLKALWAKGLSTSHIAGRLGTTKASVSGKVRRLNLPARPARMSALRLPGPRAPTPAPGADRPRPAQPAAGDVARVRLCDLEGSHCRWPAGDPREPDFGFCGQPRSPGLAWCAEHAKRAFATLAPEPATSPTPARVMEAAE